MLRFTVHSSPSAAAAYYGSGHDYLAEGEERAATWGGRLAGRLGLSGEVTKEQFLRLADGRDPHTDASLLEIRRDTRRAGTDLTWSAPKAVSLAYELSGDARVVTAFREAVEATMRDIEREVQARVRVGGAQDTRAVGNAAWATFVHRTARPVDGVADPNLHAHTFLFSVVHDGEEQKFKAAELGDIRRDANYWEAVMLSRLSSSMTDLGYAVKRDGRFFTLDGLDKPTLDKFSRRTALIVKVAAEKGVTKPEWKAELGGKTRERKKEGLTQEALKAEWVSRLTSVEKQQLGSLTGRTADLPSVAASAEFAVSHVFERSSVASSRKVAEVALRHGFGRATPEAVWPELYTHGLVTRGDQATTRRALALEAAIVKVARDGKGALKPLGHARGLPETFTAGQKSAVKHILTSRDRVILVRGAAGSGKTTMIAEAVKRVEAAGLPVHAVAVSGTAAEELEHGVTPHASTVARFLLDEKRQQSVAGGLLIVDEASLLDTVAAEKLFRLTESLDARLLLVGDLKQHAAVAAGSPFRAVQELAKLPVAEVSEVVRQTYLPYRHVSERLSRGETDKALDLLESLGWVHEADHTERMRLIVEDYRWAVKAKKSVLVVSPTHAEADRVTGELRAALKQDGRIRDDERTITRLVPLNLTAAELSEADRLGPGDVLQFHRASGKHKPGDRIAGGDATALAGAKGGFAAYRAGQLALATGDLVRVTAAGKDKSGRHKLLTGSSYTVKGFTPQGDIVLNNSWVVDKEFGHLGHGYVTTSHASQGKTVDVVLVDAPASTFAATDAATAYVGLSRGRTHARVYTDDLAGLRHAAAEQRGKSNAHDLVDPPANRVRDRATVLSRLATLARSAKEQVRQLTQLMRKDVDHGFER